MHPISPSTSRGSAATGARLLGLAFLLVLAGAGPARGQAVVVNEFMAANDTTAADPDYGSFADWIELHNTGSAAYDLTGHFLTDDFRNPSKWRFPDGTTVPAGGFLLVWADRIGTGLHASFALDRDGDRIGLYDPGAAVLDSLTFGPQRSDVSLGRDPSGPGFVYFTDPTPGRANGSDGVLGFVEAPTPSRPAGFYDSAPVVSLFGQDGTDLRYTLDGSEPTDASTAYAGPISLSATTVVRARAFRPGWAPSPVTTSTYFVSEYPSLPVVSLSTDPANFFDDRIGIYVVGTNGIPGYCRTTPHNWNQDWERPVHVEFFEPDGGLAFSQDAGVKIFGNCTRIYAQKSLALFARAKYGPTRFDYRVFPNLDLDSFNNIVLRSSAQDWWRTMFRDAMIQTLIRQGMGIETQAYRPALMFLNGEYWGIHNLREKLNEHYFAEHFGLAPEDVEILQNDKDPIAGTSAHYDAMLAFVRSTGIESDEGLDTVAEWIDVDQYLDYLAAEIYSANADWPGNNLKLWRPRTPDGRWRWAVYDMDMGFGGNASGKTETNTLALATSTQSELWSNPPWSTELLRRLLLNRRFRDRFIQRFAAHMCTTFDPDRVLAVIDSLKRGIEAEIPRHKERWPQSISYTPTWDAGIEIMRSFARGRPLQVRGHFYAKFGLPGSALLHLSVSEPGSGTIEAEGVAIPPWADPVFFRDVPLTLRAVPSPGWHFVRWEGLAPVETDAVTVTLTGESTLRAVFEPGATAVDPRAGGDLPAGFEVGAPWPNPSGSSATLPVELSVSAAVRVSLFDVLGREIGVAVDATLPAGRHAVALDLSGLAPGTVYVRVAVGGTTRFRALTRMR